MARTAWKIGAGIGAAMVAAYFLVPGVAAEDLLYWGATALGAVGVLVGMRLHRPAGRAGWYLLAAGMGASVAGWAVQVIYDLVLHTGIPTPSAADACYLAGYPLVMLGVRRLTRDPDAPNRHEDLIDAAVIALGAMALLWHVLMDSFVHDSSLSVSGRLVLMAYPILDVAVLFLVLHPVASGTRLRGFHGLLGLAFLSMFVADATYDLLLLHNAYTSANAVQGFFMAEFVLVGVAGLHPSMAEATERASATFRRRAAKGRLPLVALAGFVPLSILTVGSILHLDVDTPVLSVIGLAVSALVYLRMGWMTDRLSAQDVEIEHARALNELYEQRDALEADLRHLAFHDELTGLPNRALLLERLEHAMLAATRTGRLAALCFVDLDGFKAVNDGHGHDVGDAVLVRVGQLLTSMVRPGDTVARFGGDEFAVLIADLADPAEGEELARRLVTGFNDARRSGGELGLTVSVGLTFASPGCEAEEVVSEADAAMYEAKANGKNRVERYQPSMRSRLMERLELSTGFHGALERGEFFLEYQPIFSLADHRLNGFEALVRWNHPTRGRVPPLSFIPIAEESGFIVPLGRWIVIEACEKVAAACEESGQLLTLSVNLSRRQLVTPSLVDDVRMALALSGLSPHQLVLEVTESVLMEDPERAAAALAELRATGIQIAVDDFGTGYSSLSHLQNFPVDVLKIDKSFVDPLTDAEPLSGVMVTTIIQLARSLGLKIIAEGIEVETQRERLVDLGCDNGQGYLMARPLSLVDAEALIDSHAGRVGTV